MEPCVSFPVGGFLGVHLFGFGDGAMVRSGQASQIQRDLQPEANPRLYRPCVAVVGDSLLHLSVRSCIRFLQSSKSTMQMAAFLGQTASPWYCRHRSSPIQNGASKPDHVVLVHPHGLQDEEVHSRFS